MLSLPPSVRLFLATQPVDGRKGFDSLAAMIRSVFLHDPLSGHLYIFFSRRCDRVRVVYWDRSGYTMWTMRLERGRFHDHFSADGQPALKSIEIADLSLILESTDLAGAPSRPKWEPTPSDSDRH